MTPVELKDMIIADLKIELKTKIMLKRILLIVVLFQLSACSELQQVINQLPSGGLTNDQIGLGLKEALNNGISNQVSTLQVKDGFFKNELVKILLPEELQKVDKALRSIGLSSVADEGLKVLNRAAEDAVGEAIPIFVSAVKGMTFNDVKGILLGNDDAATMFLQGQTSYALYEKFNPIIKNSFQKVGADKIWNDLITKYNTIPFVQKVNPDLTDYVTGEALKGVYTAISIEEKEIRTKVSSRTTDLLKRVFALQD